VRRARWRACAGRRAPDAPGARGAVAKVLLGILGRYALVWAVSALALLLALSILPGFSLDTSAPGWRVAVLRLPLIFAALLILLRPVLLFLTLPLNSLTLGLPTLLFNGLILWLAAGADPAITISNYPEALVGTLVLTVVSAGVTGWLGLDEAYPFFQSVLYRVGRRFGPRPERKPLRGLLILQIDGLSWPSLEQVLARGRMPTVSAMLARRSHRLHEWHCGVPSNTPAFQAGFFYGNRENVPGYRWFDRAEQRVRVVSDPQDLRDLEAAVAAEGGAPLLAGGSVVNTFMAGGAAKRLMTVSALGEERDQRRDGERADFNLFFLSPNAYTLAVLSGLWDYLAGLAMAAVGRLRRSRPRLRFSIKRVAQRAVANTFLRDLAFFWIKQDMVRGVPVIYSNFVGYDDVAHYTDPDAYEAAVSLAAFDRHLRKLQRRAARQSPVRYDIMLLSDHGQTPSMPYRLLAGETFEATVARLLGDSQARPAEPGRAFNPDRSYTAALLAELDEAGAGDLGWAAARGRRTLAAIAPGPESGPPVTVAVEAKAVVCPSGCLAHIYFTGHDRALPLEEILERYPGFIESLVRSAGVGFVAAARQFGDAVAITGDGIRNLITGQRGGDRDPLEPYGEPDRWAGELAQLLSYPDSGDLVVNGSWLADQQRVVVFEEQSSSHGGIGGAQNRPFLLTPSWWTLGPMDLESPEALHRFLHRALRGYQRPERPAGAPGDRLGGLTKSAS
jgi:uncharacterized membrane protein YvlD (DUF360 family)